jgi:hypothetical protein
MNPIRQAVRRIIFPLAPDVGYCDVLSPLLKASWRSSTRRYRSVEGSIKAKVERAAEKNALGISCDIKKLEGYKIKDKNSLVG